MNFFIQLINKILCALFLLIILPLSYIYFLIQYILEFIAKVYLFTFDTIEIFFTSIYEISTTDVSIYHFIKNHTYITVNKILDIIKYISETKIIRKIYMRFANKESKLGEIFYITYYNRIDKKEYNGVGCITSENQYYVNPMFYKIIDLKIVGNLLLNDSAKDIHHRLSKFGDCSLFEVEEKIEEFIDEIEDNKIFNK